jgi:two-component system sensor histidine kinase RegB
MKAPTFGEIVQDYRGDWVRLRTLTYIRGVAVTGQMAALVIGMTLFDLRFDLTPVALVMAAAGVSILLALLLFPPTRRLSSTEAMLTFLFDIAQLCALLYLTGGITNPFALLITAPVAVAAMALPPRLTLLLTGVAIVLISVLSVYYLPLRFADGTILVVPAILKFGTWAAIVIGVSFQAYYAFRVAGEGESLSDALLAAQMALSREQKLTDLGGVVAATAHELGTPLATIKLVATELADELSNQPDLAEDARLLVAQADRCRDILHAMGRRGKDDTLLHQAPLQAVLHEAAEPHLERGKDVAFALAPAPGGSDVQPLILRRPEIIHGLRNLIQNAVDFAGSRVQVEARWSKDRLLVTIRDDGPGFAPAVLASMGEPFIGRRRDPGRQSRRPGYQGMGLGTFIAKTLLERTGARLDFGNGEPASALPGARVAISWTLSRIAVPPDQPMPLNQPIEG